MQNTIDIMQTFNEALKKSKHSGFKPTPEQAGRIQAALADAIRNAAATMVRTDRLGLFKDHAASAEDNGKVFLVDVYRTLGQTVRVRADSREQAEERIDEMINDGSVQWDISQLTDDIETEVCGEVNADGEEYYW